MKITACLCWYDETAELLERCVDSLAGFVDELVAFDGRWDLYPAPKRGEGDIVHSPMWQQYALVEAAHNAGIPLRREVARQSPWPSQVDKRNALLQAAAESGDWLLVIDADEWIEGGEARGLRAELMRTGADVAFVDYQMYVDGRPRSRYPIRRLYRAASGVHIETAHNGHRTSDGRWLHGDTSYVQLEHAEELQPWLTLGEETNARSIERQMAKREYRKARGRERVEVWV